MSVINRCGALKKEWLCADLIVLSPSPPGTPRGITFLGVAPVSLSLHFSLAPPYTDTLITLFCQCLDLIYHTHFSSDPGAARGGWRQNNLTGALECLYRARQGKNEVIRRPGQPPKKYCPRGCPGEDGDRTIWPAHYNLWGSPYMRSVLPLHTNWCWMRSRDGSVITIRFCWERA